MHRVLITGGAGFIGANLAVALAERQPDWRIVALDNLHRRGSELNLERLEAAGVEFVRADVRDAASLAAAGSIDALVECSAEPSAVLAAAADTSYSVHTNLFGAYNCLELVRRESAQFVFLSTSRVYPFEPLAGIAIEEGPKRFTIGPSQETAGVTAAGISEAFPLEGPRTLYGATKLAAELLITEYAARFGLRASIDRCGVVAGPWQMGKVDQGVFALWVMHHHFGEPLTYIGFGGSGKQVRDLLHVDDLVDLVELQLLEPDGWAGFVGNVGGGPDRSLSLLELTEIARRLTGKEVPIEPVAEPRFGDVPLYLSDCSRLYARTEWRPRREAEQTIADISEWVGANDSLLAPALGF